MSRRRRLPHARRRPTPSTSGLVERLSFGLSVLGAIVLLVVARAAPAPLVQGVARVEDSFAPVLEALAAPASVLHEGWHAAREWSDLRRAHERLRDENERLRGWALEVRRLEAENRTLRAALSLSPARGGPTVLSARVLAEQGGPFARSILIDAGAEQGVVKGMAAAGAEGLVGRVVTVGRRSARVLLLTDLTSKLPVVVAPGGDRALLVGDNGPTARLAFLPLEPSLRVGDEVVTSGSGGALPAGLPVGRVTAVEEDGAIVRPFADDRRLDVLRLLAVPEIPDPEHDPAPAVPTGGPALAAHGLEP